MNEILKNYLGTKNFYNFTSTKGLKSKLREKNQHWNEVKAEIMEKVANKPEYMDLFEDTNFVRKQVPSHLNVYFHRNLYIFKCKDVIEINNEKYIRIVVGGGSFLYLQIR